MGAPGHFYYHDRMMTYDFGPQHPLRPVRLAKTMSLVRAWMPQLEFLDPGLADRSDVRRVHSQEYVNAVETLSGGGEVEEPFVYGFKSIDNPPFTGMYEAALAYTGGGVRAAEALLEGAPMAINIGGGLHHARSEYASGFCIFNDPAIGIHVLRDKYKKVAYIDIDLHHGDGVQWIWYDEPDVLTYSIHQDGRTLYPGCGAVDERGAEGSSVNVPLAPGTTGEVWLNAFRETALPALERFQPEAIVLQMGCDPHFKDPLGRLQVRVEDWVEAVRLVRDLRLPTLACGGGGYELTNVPRMWAAAILTLYDQEVPETIPEELQADLGIANTFDRITQPATGEEQAERVIEYWRRELG